MVKATAVKFNPEGKFHARVKLLFLFLFLRKTKEEEDENCNVFILVNKSDVRCIVLLLISASIYFYM